MMCRIQAVFNRSMRVKHAVSEIHPRVHRHVLHLERIDPLSFLYTDIQSDRRPAFCVTSSPPAADDYVTVQTGCVCLSEEWEQTRPTSEGQQRGTEAPLVHDARLVSVGSSLTYTYVRYTGCPEKYTIEIRWYS